jgi:hypothetical protein
MEIKLSAFLVKSFLLRGDDDFWKVLVVIASSESRLEFVTDRWCLGRTHKQHSRCDSLRLDRSHKK